MGNLKGKTALVTGTSQGIGAAISETLIDAGCDICMHYYRSSNEPDRLKKRAEDMGQKALIIHSDLTDPAAVVACVQRGIDYFGSFDILVNNSGTLVERRSINGLDMAYWQKVVDVNMTTMMLVTKEVLPHMRRGGGSIVNLSSLAGRKGGGSGSLVYSTTKGAVLAWTRTLASELAPEGIRVNAVAPGFIEGTSFHETYTSREAASKIIAEIPLGRSGNPFDVARAVAFLASEYDGFITGATIDINGGVYCA